MSKEDSRCADELSGANGDMLATLIAKGALDVDVDKVVRMRQASLRHGSLEKVTHRNGLGTSCPSELDVVDHHRSKYYF